MLFEFRNSGEYEAAGGTQSPAKEKGGCHLCTGGITSPCCVAKAPAPDDCPWMEATDGVYSVRKTPSFGATVLRFFPSLSWQIHHFPHQKLSTSGASVGDRH